MEKEENKITIPMEKGVWEWVIPIVITIIVSTVTAILLKK